MALILQFLGENSRKLDFLSVSPSKNSFWLSSLSSSRQNGYCTPFYILGFQAPAGQDYVFLLQREVFSLQQVVLGCTPGPLILKILVAANLVLAFMLAAANTLCLDSP